MLCNNPPLGRDRRSNAETCHELSTPGLGVVCDPGHSVSWSLEFASGSPPQQGEEHSMAKALVQG